MTMIMIILGYICLALLINEGAGDKVDDQDDIVGIVGWKHLLLSQPLVQMRGHIGI